MADWDISTAGEEFLVDLCQKTLEEEGSIGDVGGIPEVKISPNIAAKIGRCVTASEAATQAFAHKELDPSIVYVPKVYRYFRRSRGVAYDEHNEHGYLFMEYIPGQKLQDLETAALAELVPRAVEVIEHLGHVRGRSAPGSVGGGIPMGHIFGDDGAKTSGKSVDEINAYMNKHLEYRNIYLSRRRGIECNDTIDITPHPLVLCHGDICRRNLILREDRSLCLLDWGYAGFYPRFFEVVTLKCTMPYLDVFEGALEREAEGMMQLTDEEQRDLQLVKSVRGANLRWSL
jgi:serine/threonine protein kinase